MPFFTGTGQVSAIIAGFIYFTLKILMGCVAYLRLYFIDKGTGSDWL